VTVVSTCPYNWIFQVQKVTTINETRTGYNQRAFCQKILLNQGNKIHSSYCTSSTKAALRQITALCAVCEFSSSNIEGQKNITNEGYTAVNQYEIKLKISVRIISN